MCGDHIEVELEIDDGQQILNAMFSGDGCCISQAAASMLLEHLQGKNVAEVRAFTAHQMLGLFGARLTSRRQQCCLLAWRALQSATACPIQAPISALHR
jgi:nitrogen fixation NifU-like protein